MKTAAGDVPAIAAMNMVVLFIRSVEVAFHSPALSAIIHYLVLENQLAEYVGYSQSLRS